MHLVIKRYLTSVPCTSFLTINDTEKPVDWKPLYRPFTSSLVLCVGVLKYLQKQCKIRKKMYRPIQYKTIKWRSLEIYFYVQLDTCSQ